MASLGAFSPVDHHYLLQARQMQALSFSVHIPLVCFGIPLDPFFGHASDGAAFTDVDRQHLYRIKYQQPTRKRSTRR